MRTSFPSLSLLVSEEDREENPLRFLLLSFSLSLSFSHCAHSRRAPPQTSKGESLYERRGRANLLSFSRRRRSKENKMDPPDKPLSASSIVTLCVGGQEFATTVTTLRKVMSDESVKEAGRARGTN